MYIFVENAVNTFHCYRHSIIISGSTHKSHAYAAHISGDAYDWDPAPSFRAHRTEATQAKFRVFDSYDFCVVI